MWFKATSQLKINLDKSEVILVFVCGCWGGGVTNVEILASVLGCRIGKLATSYFGLPLGVSFKSSRIWDAVEERFGNRFAMWKK